MNEKKDLFDDICNSFEKLYWHDSRIINLRLLKDSANKRYNLELDIDLYEKNSLGKIEQVLRTVVFKECRIIQVDFDLLGVLFCNGDISSASCHKDAVQFEETKRDKLKYFDFPDAFNSLDSCLGFSIELIHPSGEIIIFAKNFEVIKPV